MPYRMMIEQMQDGALTLTGDGVVTYCNRRFAEFTGFSAPSVVGKRLTSFVHPDDASRVVACLHEAHNSGTRWKCRLSGDGSGALPVLVSATPLEVDGRGALCLAVTSLSDLQAARRESQQLKEAAQALEIEVAERTAQMECQAKRLRLLALQLSDAEHRERKRVAEVLHDHLQQLLVAAKMRLERFALAGDAVSAVEDVRRLLQESIDCARSLSAELRPPVLYQDGLIAAIQWLGQHTKSQYAIDVRTELDPHAEPAEEKVKVFLYQAVRELVFNAIKHAHVTEIRVSADVDASGRVRISVQDGGSGFDVAAMRDRQMANEGVGLFSVQERISALGGTMAIASSPGTGTRITLGLMQKRPGKVARGGWSGDR